MIYYNNSNDLINLIRANNHHHRLANSNMRRSLNNQYQHQNQHLHQQHHQSVPSGKIIDLRNNRVQKYENRRTLEPQPIRIRQLNALPTSTQKGGGGGSVPFGPPVPKNLFTRRRSLFTNSLSSMPGLINPRFRLRNVLFKSQPYRTLFTRLSTVFEEDDFGDLKTNMNALAYNTTYSSNNKKIYLNEKSSKDKKLSKYLNKMFRPTNYYTSYANSNNEIDYDSYLYKETSVEANKNASSNIISNHNNNNNNISNDNHNNINSDHIYISKGGNNNLERPKSVSISASAAEEVLASAAAAVAAPVAVASASAVEEKEEASVSTSTSTLPLVSDLVNNVKHRSSELDSPYETYKITSINSSGACSNSNRGNNNNNSSDTDSRSRSNSINRKSSNAELSNKTGDSSNNNNNNNTTSNHHHHNNNNKNINASSSISIRNNRSSSKKENLNDDEDEDHDDDDDAETGFNINRRNTNSSSIGSETKSISIINNNSNYLLHSELDMIKTRKEKEFNENYLSSNEKIVPIMFKPPTDSSQFNTNNTNNNYNRNHISNNNSNVNSNNSGNSLRTLTRSISASSPYDNNHHDSNYNNASHKYGTNYGPSYNNAEERSKSNRPKSFLGSDIPIEINKYSTPSSPLPNRRNEINLPVNFELSQINKSNIERRSSTGTDLPVRFELNSSSPKSNLKPTVLSSSSQFNSNSNNSYNYNNNNNSRNLEIEIPIQISTGSTKRIEEQHEQIGKLNKANNNVIYRRINHTVPPKPSILVSDNSSYSESSSNKITKNNENLNQISKEQFGKSHSAIPFGFDFQTNYLNNYEIRNETNDILSNNLAAVQHQQQQQQQSQANRSSLKSDISKSYNSHGENVGFFYNDPIVNRMDHPKIKVIAKGNNDSLPPKPMTIGRSASVKFLEEALANNDSYKSSKENENLKATVHKLANSTNNLNESNQKGSNIIETESTTNDLNESHTLKLLTLNDNNKDSPTSPQSFTSFKFDDLNDSPKPISESVILVRKSPMFIADPPQTLKHFMESAKGLDESKKKLANSNESSRQTPISTINTSQIDVSNDSNSYNNAPESPRYDNQFDYGDFILNKTINKNSECLQPKQEIRQQINETNPSQIVKKMNSNNSVASAVSVAASSNLNNSFQSNNNNNSESLKRENEKSIEQSRQSTISSNMFQNIKANQPERVKLEKQNSNEIFSRSIDNEIKYHENVESSSEKQHHQQQHQQQQQQQQQIKTLTAEQVLAKLYSNPISEPTSSYSISKSPKKDLKIVENNFNNKPPTNSNNSTNRSSFILNEKSQIDANNSSKTEKSYQDSFNELKTKLDNITADWTNTQQTMPATQQPTTQTKSVSFLLPPEQSKPTVKLTGHQQTSNSVNKNSANNQKPIKSVHFSEDKLFSPEDFSSQKANSNNSTKLNSTSFRPAVASDSVKEFQSFGSSLSNSADQTKKNENPINYSAKSTVYDYSQSNYEKYINGDKVFSDQVSAKNVSSSSSSSPLAQSAQPNSNPTPTNKYESITNFNQKPNTDLFTSPTIPPFPYTKIDQIGQIGSTSYDYPYYSNENSSYDYSSKTNTTNSISGTNNSNSNKDTYLNKDTTYSTNYSKQFVDRNNNDLNNNYSSSNSSDQNLAFYRLKDIENIENCKLENILTLKPINKLEIIETNNYNSILNSSYPELKILGSNKSTNEKSSSNINMELNNSSNTYASNKPNLVMPNEQLVTIINDIKSTVESILLNHSNASTNLLSSSTTQDQQYNQMASGDSSSSFYLNEQQQQQQNLKENGKNIFKNSQTITSSGLNNNNNYEEFYEMYYNKV